MSVVNIVDAVYVELLDSENNIIEGYFGLLIGSPMFSSKEVDVEFILSITSGTIRHSFLLTGEKEERYYDKNQL